MWGYSRWKVTGSRWWLAACWLAMALGLAFSPQPVIAVLYVGLLSVLVSRATCAPTSSRSPGWRSSAAPTSSTRRSAATSPPPARTSSRRSPTCSRRWRAARCRRSPGSNLPDRLWLLALLGVLGAVALSALGRRGLEGLAFLLVVLVANGVVIWFGRSGGRRGRRDRGALPRGAHARLLGRGGDRGRAVAARTVAPAAGRPRPGPARRARRARGGRARARLRVGGQPLPGAARGRLPRLAVHAADERRGARAGPPARPRPRPPRPLRRPGGARQQRGAVPLLLRPAPDQSGRLPRARVQRRRRGGGPRAAAVHAQPGRRDQARDLHRRGPAGPPPLQRALRASCARAAPPRRRSCACACAPASA